MNFLIAIPSYQRAHVLETHTLRFLSRAQVPASQIHLFIVDNPTEREAYQHFATLGHPIHYGPVGLHHMRNFIHQTFPVNTNILSMDDDLRTLVRMQEDPTIPNLKSAKRYPLHDDMHLRFISWCNSAFQRLSDEHITLFGIYPVKNGYFMKSLPEITTDLRFCVGTCWGIRNPSDMIIHIEEKEDVERTLLCWKRDHKILRFNHITAVTRYYHTLGGMQAHQQDRKENAKTSCQYLLKHFPEWCTLYTSKKSGVYEVRLRSS